MYRYTNLAEDEADRVKTHIRRAAIALHEGKPRVAADRLHKAERAQRRLDDLVRLFGYRRPSD